MSLLFPSFDRHDVTMNNGFCPAFHKEGMTCSTSASAAFTIASTVFTTQAGTGALEAGDIITGASSSASGTVTQVGKANELYVTITNGTFQEGETLRCVSSGAEAIFKSAKSMQIDDCTSSNVEQQCCQYSDYKGIDDNDFTWITAMFNQFSVQEEWGRNNGGLYEMWPIEGGGEAVVTDYNWFGMQKMTRPEEDNEYTAKKPDNSGARLLGLLSGMIALVIGLVVPIAARKVYTYHVTQRRLDMVLQDETLREW